MYTGTTATKLHHPENCVPERCASQARQLRASMRNGCTIWKITTLRTKPGTFQNRNGKVIIAASRTAFAVNSNCRRADRYGTNKGNSGSTKKVYCFDARNRPNRNGSQR